MLTVSNALLMSSATMIVREGGWRSLNPLAIVSLMWCRAVAVECFCLKPC